MQQAMPAKGKIATAQVINSTAQGDNSHGKENKGFGKAVQW
jgi:hypothetical protein